MAGPDRPAAGEAAAGVQGRALLAAAGRAQRRGGALLGLPPLWMPCQLTLHRRARRTRARPSIPSIHPIHSSIMCQPKQCCRHASESGRAASSACSVASSGLILSPTAASAPVTPPQCMLQRTRSQQIDHLGRVLAAKHEPEHQVARAQGRAHRRLLDDVLEQKPAPRHRRHTSCTRTGTTQTRPARTPRSAAAAPTPAAAPAPVRCAQPVLAPNRLGRPGRGGGTCAEGECMAVRAHRSWRKGSVHTSKHARVSLASCTCVRHRPPMAVGPVPRSICDAAWATRMRRYRVRAGGSAALPAPCPPRPASRHPRSTLARRGADLEFAGQSQYVLKVLRRCLPVHAAAAPRKLVVGQRHVLLQQLRELIWSQLGGGAGTWQLKATSEAAQP